MSTEKQSTDKMTTFSTRNQSRKKIYKILIAGGLVLILFTVITLFRKHKAAQMYKGYDQQQLRSRSNSSPADILMPKSSDKNNINERVPEKSQPVKSKTPFYKADSVLKETKLVQIPQNGGPVKGQVRRTVVSRGDKMVSSFLGIPYAAPPIDDLRFEGPKSAPTWTEVKEAYYQPPKCPQGSYLFSSITESRNEQNHENEDCLYLNIWTPSEDYSQKKPVLVYIHSGLFGFGSIGSPDLDPSNLTAEHDIVVVTVQYRLGALGFASFDPENSKEDFHSVGLQDQIRALEWIQTNIGAFGGDAQLVTLTGHGAGAVSVGAHLLNPVTNKLFKRVIVQGMDNIWNIGLYGLNVKASHFLVNDLGCEMTMPTSKSWKKCIKKMKIHLNTIIEAQQHQMEVFAVPFGPEFNPHTSSVATKLFKDNSTAEIPAKPLVEQLKTIFQDWNLFPQHIEFMIGLNSDDDYKLESINKNNSEITFEDEEEEDEEEEVNVGNSSSDSSSPNSNSTSNSMEDNDDLMAVESKKDDNKSGEENESDETNEENENTKDATTTPQTSDDNEMTTITPNNETISPMVSTTETSRVARETPSLVQRKRRKRSAILRRYRRNAITPVHQITLDLDENKKLCRLVNLYRAQRTRDPEKVSGAMYLYRVDPKVLQSPLEEVSIAFGSKQKNWLIGFDERLMNLWGSFVRMGDFSQMNKIGLDYHSKLSELDSDLVEMINLGQEPMEDNKSDDVGSYDQHRTHKSELKIATVDQLKTLCANV